MRVEVILSGQRIDGLGINDSARGGVAGGFHQQRASARIQAGGIQTERTGADHTGSEINLADPN